MMQRKYNDRHSAGGTISKLEPGGEEEQIADLMKKQTSYQNVEQQYHSTQQTSNPEQSYGKQTEGKYSNKTTQNLRDSKRFHAS